MTDRIWLRRTAYGLVWGLVAWGFTAWVGLRPRSLLVVVATVSCALFVGLLSELHTRVAAISWSAPRRQVRPRYGLDPRFSRLSQSLIENRDPDVLAAQLHATLVRVIDDRLVSHHGIDRTAQPEQAYALLGAELTAYVNTPRPRSSRKHLHELLSRIEAL